MFDKPFPFGKENQSQAKNDLATGFQPNRRNYRTDKKTTQVKKKKRLVPSEGDSPGLALFPCAVAFPVIEIYDPY
jgi:hypothetical protein